MNAFDVRIHMMRRRKNKRRPFEVRWRVAGRDNSKSFLTRALADSYRAELIRAARQGMEFDPATVRDSKRLHAPTAPARLCPPYVREQPERPRHDPLPPASPAPAVSRRCLPG